jgi:hypothetical protein
MNYNESDVESFRKIALELFDGSVDPSVTFHFSTLGWVKQMDTNPSRWLITDDGSRQIDSVIIWPAVASADDVGFVATIKAMRLRGTSQIGGRTIAAGSVHADRELALRDAQAMADRWERLNPLLKRRDKA